MRRPELDYFLTTMLDSQPEVSDLLFTVDKPLQVESFGELKPVVCEPPIEKLTPFQTETVALNIMGDNLWHIGDLLRRGSCDTAYTLADKARFRISIFSQRGNYSIVLRKLNTVIPTLDWLNFPEVIKQIPREKTGLVLVTGATGSGKSTTLAAVLNEVSHTRAVHIITLEDPIEFVHPHDVATFNQRELGSDFDSFSNGLRAALRQAPKVILVGEMRDRETIKIALSAAETGHLVLSTLHTVDAGQTINRITLFALILSLGLLVDAAIVVVENIHRHLHHGGAKNFGEALVAATNEIGNPTNIATIAVILAFIPMAFVTGMMGPFMLPIPFNVPVAMIASLLIAYVVVPWAAHRWLKGKALKSLEQAPTLEEKDAQPQDPLHRAYMAVITPLIRNSRKRNLMFLVVLALLGAAMIQPAWQFVRPQGMNGPLSALGVELKMLPNDNTGTFLLEVDMPAGTALAGTDQVARAVGDVLARTPYVTDYQTFLGTTAPVDFAALVRGDMLKRGTNLAQLRVNLVSKHERSESSHEIVTRLDQAMMPVRQLYPTAKIKLYETPPGPPVQAQVLAELYGPDYNQLRAAALDVNKAFSQIYGMINVDDSVTANVDSYQVQVDREKAILAGVAPAQIAKLLHDYVSGFAIGTLHVDSAREPINIIVRLPSAERQTPEQILALRVTSAMGRQVPLSALATVTPVTQAKPIYDRDQHPMVMVGSELLRSSPVYAVLALDSMLDNKALPHSGVRFKTGNLGFQDAQPDDVLHYHLLWGGEMRLTLDVFRDLGSAFIVALILIYLVLVGYYKSFMMPVIVMGAIPLTLVGVFPGHWLTHQAFTATSMIGVIALAGIVVRNSLLLIDFILDYRARGYSLEESVIQAGAIRFRPILLTALAIILGSAIMITDPVFGGLAVSLIFGTFASTALTLVVIPLLYYLWQRGSAARLSPGGA